MANSLTFDPSAGTPVAVNLTINRVQTLLMILL
jgi:hypothetical protein